MIHSSKRNVRALISIAKQKGVKHIVFSPGSRNAPLIIGFTADPHFSCISIPDERSAGFIALGIAQATGTTVVVCCTSGSAAVNYYPAVTEAFYQRIPLVVVTADRPQEMIDQADGQTIRQVGVFANHIYYQANLQNDAEDAQSASYTERVLNEAFNEAWINPGPVHINMPFKEPLYGTLPPETPIEKWRNIRAVPCRQQPTNEWDELALAWNQSNKKLIIIGQLPPDHNLTAYINTLAEDPGTLIFTESTSNINVKNAIIGIDRVVNTVKREHWRHIKADILLTIGEAVVSKKVKTMLRENKPDQHWHVAMRHPHPDTYQALTVSVMARPHAFLEFLAEHSILTNGDFGSRWIALDKSRDALHESFLAQAPYSDLTVYGHILPALPANSVLHLANSSPVRYVQLFKEGRHLPHYANRGASGIDGCTSTALGYSLASDKINILISGDIAFLYDSNAFLNRNVPQNLRVIVINNGGGNIFRIIGGPDQTRVMDEFFEAAQPANISGIAETYGLEYVLIQTEDELKEALPEFFNEAGGAAIMEIITPRDINPEVLENYFKYLRNG